MGGVGLDERDGGGESGGASPEDEYVERWGRHC